MRILIIEDDRVTARLYTDWLVKAGHEVQVATSGTGALTVASSFSPGGVVLDLMLPDISGMEVLVRIKSDLPDARVIACTNGFIPALVENALANGAAHVLDKSILTAPDLALNFEEPVRR